MACVVGHFGLDSTVPAAEVDRKRVTCVVHVVARLRAVVLDFRELAAVHADGLRNAIVLEVLMPEGEIVWFVFQRFSMKLFCRDQILGRPSLIASF